MSTWRKVTEGSGREVARRPGDQEVGVGQLTQEDTPSAGCEDAGGLEAGFGCEVSVSNRTCGLSLEGRKQSLVPAMERVLAELTAPWLRVFIF